MKPVRVCKALFVLGLLLPSAAVADELDLRFGGALQSDLRFRLEPVGVGDYYQRLELPDGIARNENIFKGKVEASYGRITGVAEVDFVWLGFPEELDQIGDLTSRGMVDPYYLQVHALYAEAVDLFVEGLDLRVGYQQVKWGVGDQFNPTNTLNANDIEDVLLFGEQMANMMVKLDFAIWDMWTVSGVLVPVFRPAQLPRSAELGLSATDRYPFLDESLRNRLTAEKALTSWGMADFLGNPDLVFPTVVGQADPVLPERSLENMQFAFRIAGTILEQDIAVSYYRGRSDIPQPIRNETVQRTERIYDPLDSETYVAGLLDTKVSLGYPKIQVVGLNLAGELDLLGWISDAIRPIGYRLELAVYVPEKVRIGLFQEEIDLGAITQPAGEYDYDLDGEPGGPLPVVVDSIPFYKWVLGLDYSFGAHVMANVMWVHGLVDDFGIGWAVRQAWSTVEDPGDLFLCALNQDYGACSSHEILRPRLGDYLVFGLDTRFLDDRLLIRLFTIWDLTGIYEGDWDAEGNRRIKSHHAFYTEKGFSAVIYPEIQYNFGGGFELHAGALLQLGKEYSKFGDPAAGGSLIWTRARFSF